MTPLLLHQRGLWRVEVLPPHDATSHVLRRTHLFMLRHHPAIMHHHYRVDCLNSLQTCQSSQPRTDNKSMNKFVDELNFGCVPGSKLEVRTGNSAMHSWCNTIEQSTVYTKVLQHSAMVLSKRWIYVVKNLHHMVFLFILAMVEGTELRLYYVAIPLL